MPYADAEQVRHLHRAVRDIVVLEHHSAEILLRHQYRGALAVTMATAALLILLMHAMFVEAWEPWILAALAVTLGGLVSTVPGYYRGIRHSADVEARYRAAITDLNRLGFDSGDRFEIKREMRRSLSPHSAWAQPKIRNRGSNGEHRGTLPH